MPRELLLHSRAPLRIVGSKRLLRRLSLDCVRGDFPRVPPGQTAVEDSASREGVNQSGRIARQQDPRSDSPLQRQRDTDRSCHLLDDLASGESRGSRDEPVQILLGICALPDLREVHADPDVGHIRVLPEHPRVAAGGAAAEVEVVQPRIAIDTHQSVLQAGVDVPRSQRGLEARPASDLALEAVGTDDHLRVNVERLAHVLAPRTDDAPVLLEERDRAGLDHDLGAGLCGLACEEPVEQIPLQDVSAFVAGTSLIEDQRPRSEEHTSELQSQSNLVCRLLLEKKKKTTRVNRMYMMYQAFSYAPTASS